MTTFTTPSKSLPFELGAPRSHRGLTVLPLFPSEKPRLDYVGLDEALARGLTVREATESGDVNTLLLDNPLGEYVLLYEGEELVGAKQNRIVERTVLVGPKTIVRLPVNCVERGRWAYRSSAFATAPHAAYPDLRRAQARHRASGAQAQVWAEVAAKSQRLEVASPTEAAQELYVSRAPALEDYAQALPRLDGQSGALVACGGTVVCLDYVGRSDVFAGLYAKLLRGYALEAVEVGAKPVSKAALARFLRAVSGAERHLDRPVGLGSEARLGGEVIGAELEAFGELVALSAYPLAA